MQVAYLEKDLSYDGSQLASHFAWAQRGLLGDSCVAFEGACRVGLESLVDLEDLKDEAPIFSPRMLHFIFEGFGWDLPRAVLFQRLMVVVLKEILEEKGIKALRRRGDDIFQADKKLTVSIATVSPVSALIHLGVNIHTQGTPVPTVGLEELGLKAKELANDCLEKFSLEYKEMLKASYKVRAVN